MQAIIYNGWLAKVNAWYRSAEHNCTCEPAPIAPTAIDTSAWEKLIESIAKDMESGKIKPGQLNADMVRATFDEIKQGAAKGYGKSFTKFGDDAGRDRAVLKMQHNIFRFSGAKTYAQLSELNDKLYKDGKVVPFQEFRDEALKINEKYNLNYLQAEYQTARQSGHHARNWQQYVEDMEVFPNLEYRTAGDKRVRKDHEKLEGTIAPVNSSFWDSYYPPNGWRCRCYVVQTAASASVHLPNDPSVKDEFKLNVGKESTVFKESGKGSHPYFTLLKEDTEALSELDRQMVKVFRDQVRDWAKENITGKAAVSHKKLKEDIELSNTDVKSITGKPHEDQTARNELLYNIGENFEGSQFLFSAPEHKGRSQYVTWYYFKDKSGNFFYNVVKMSDGTFRLHAITDKVTKP